MLRKISTLFVALMMLAMMVKAQDHAILTPGDQLIPIKGRTIEAALTGAKVNVMNHNKVGNIILKGHSLQDAKGTIDTLSIKETSGATFNVNFGFFDQDVMIQWYVAPADLIIKGVAFMPSDGTGAANGVAVSIVGTGLTAADLVSLGAPVYWGYWTGDDPTWNNAVPFPWQASGDWVAGTEGAVAPWTTDLWSDFGDGYVVTPVYDPDNPAYNWVVLNDALGFEPDQISRGEVFGVVFKNNGVDASQPSESRIGLLSAGSMSSHPGFKYYSKGRLATDDQGWWARKYTWDAVVAVDLVGDRPPVITGVDVLPTTLSTEARTVTATITDDNPSGGTAGVASAVISYTTDGSTWSDVAMTANGDVYSGDIPGQQPGTTVDYKVVATDVNGNTSEAGPWEYNIFQAVESTLLVFNGFNKPAGYPQSYYFGQDDFVTYSTYPFLMDVWAYGPLTADLVDNYTNIIEITTAGPTAINSSVIGTWLAADGSRNYMLTGDEWLGAQSGWANGPHAAGEFIFDVLGINYEYNDINYAATGDQNGPSVVMPVEGTLLGGPLYTKFTEINDTTASNDTMLYYPSYELGSANWLDGVDFEADVEVDMLGVGADGNTYNIGGHRTLGKGNKVTFLAFDPLSLDSAPDYYWYGFSASAPQVQAALWMGVASGVSPISNEIPNGFALSQNYPNPFNPTTSINFALKVDSKVQLKVYNLLGQVVASEVYGNLNAGTHKYTFDGANLSSGVYFYNINVEGVDGSKFSATKKMMLLK